MTKQAAYILATLSIGPMLAGFTAALGVLFAIEVVR